MTILELKQDFVDYLGAMDKTRMNMVDLNVYANVLKMVDDMMRPDRTSELMEMAKCIYSDKNPSVYNCCETEVNDG